MGVVACGLRAGSSGVGVVAYGLWVVVLASVLVILGGVDGMLLILVLIFGYGYGLFDSFDVDLVWRVVVAVCGFVFRLLVFSGCYLMVWIWLVVCCISLL